MTEQTLATFMAAHLARLTSEDAILARIEKNLEEVANRSIDDAFRSYGDIAKTVDALIKKALTLPENMTIDDKSHMLMRIVEKKLNEYLDGEVADRIARQSDELMNIAPKEIRLSEIVEHMKRGIIQRDGEQYSYGHKIRCDIETKAGGYAWISLDEKREANFLSSTAEVRIGVSDTGEIYSLYFDGYDAKKTVVFDAYPHWKKVLWGAITRQARLIIDEDEIRRSIGDD